MSTNIKITVANLIATAQDNPTIVCGNSGYTVEFTFDEAWAVYLIKTVRFAWIDARTGQRRHIDSQYTGEPIGVPVIADAYEVQIGAYAGNIISSTGARIPCVRCITDDATYHGGTTPDIYAELLDQLGHLPDGADSLNQPVRLHISNQGTPGYYEHFEPTRAMLAAAAAAEQEEPEEPNEEEVR